MRFVQALNGKPSVIFITVRTNTPTSLAFVGFDELKKNAYYFAREKKVMGEQRLEFPLPQAPISLTIDISKLGGGYGDMVSVLNVEVKELPSATITYEKGTYDFVKFIQSFCQKMGERNEGFFVSKDENYIIWLKPHIDTSGTPAKINRRTGVIKVATDKFHKYTIPMRMFILLHEYFHWYYQSTDEKKVDRSAISLYMQLMYPKTEANYAMSRVFTDGREAGERMQQMSDILKKSEQQRKRQATN